MSENNYSVKVSNGSEKGAQFDVKQEALVLGSGEQADIRLTGKGVEARHAQIVFQGGQVILEDLGTQSGTFRNGKRLLGPIQVFPGDRVGLGPEVVLILQGDDPRQGAGEETPGGVIGKAINDLAEDLGLGGEEKGEA